jgi:hypothetical protein
MNKLSKLISEKIERLAEERKAMVALQEYLAGRDCELETTIISLYSSIDFDNPSRSDVEKLLTVLEGTKWVKSKLIGTTKLNYESVQPVVDGRKLRLWAAQPPGTCRMVEEKVVIPARPERTEVRMVLHCEPEAAEKPAPEPEKVEA